MGGMRQISSSHVFSVIERHIECVGQFQVILGVMTTYHLSFFPREDIKDEAGLFQRIHIQMSDYSALHPISNTNTSWLKKPLIYSINL